MTAAQNSAQDAAPRGVSVRNQTVQPDVEMTLGQELQEAIAVRLVGGSTIVHGSVDSD
jgi:hypothetical protein